MSQLSFAYVPQSGFAAFHASMTANPWSLVDSSNYDDPTKSLWSAPPLVAVKVRLKRTIDTLLIAIAGAGGAKSCDRNWDRCQKQLSGLLGVYSAASDPAKRDAAKRLQNILLMGSGVAQTLLRYQEEVDYGRKQLALVTSGQAAADIALLSLGPMMNEIGLATESLASVIGHGATTVPPHERRSRAMNTCVTAFESAAKTLEWLIEEGGEGQNKDIAAALLASLKDLADRYPMPARPTHTPDKHAPEKPIEAPPPSIH